MDQQIELKRETEFYQGFIRLKMSVSNKTSFVITDVTLDFIYEDDLLRIDRHEPHYELRKDKILLGNINGGTSKSIAVYFDPLMCTKGAEINCQVTFRDSKGKISSVFMEPKMVSVVCPILKTDLDINIGRLKEFIEKLPSKDSKIYEIHHGFNIDKLALITREVVEKHDVRHVRSLKTKDGRDWEIWYYGKTKVTNSDIVIKVSIYSEKQLLELFAATENDETLTGLLAEVGRDLKHSIESRAAGRGNVINVTIKDSVVQRSNLLDYCDVSGRCSTNIIVEDSVVQHSSIVSFSEDIESNKGSEPAKNEVEESESLRKKREELERLKAEMEELRKQREEKEQQKKEKEAHERKKREEEGRLNKNVVENGEDSGLPGIDMLFDPKSNKEEGDKKNNLKDHEEISKKQNAEKNVKEWEEQVPPKKSLSPPAAKKQESSSGKGGLVFGLIFGIIVLVSAAALLDSDSGSANTTQTMPLQNLETYTNSLGMEFVKIPAGEFKMGSHYSEKDRDFDEGSVHKVTIEEPFYLGKFEVTQEQWQEVMGSNPSNFKGDDLPVENVSWNDVQEFIEKLNEMEGINKYSLPSEAEWEYACRAGTTTRYSFGDDESKLGDYAWYRDNSGDSTHPIGQKKPNPWGLYDTYGNVAEWCQDTWHDGYYGAPSDGSSWEDESGSFWVFRGGCWFYSAGGCRSASRSYNEHYIGLSHLGFRVLRTL